MRGWSHFFGKQWRYTTMEEHLAHVRHIYDPDGSILPAVTPSSYDISRLRDMLLADRERAFDALRLAAGRAWDQGQSKSKDVEVLAEGLSGAGQRYMHQGR